MAVTYASNVFTVAQNAQTAGTGTITCAATTIKLGAGTFGATAVTGTGTAFTAQLRPGSLITVGAVNLLVHSVQSATALIAFRQSNTDNTYTLATSAAFTFCAPTLWADLLAAVAGQASTIAHGNVTSVNFTAASLTINSSAVLVADDPVSMTFGNAGGYRVNNNQGYLVFRNGGMLTYTGNIQHSFFNGYLNVWAGTLTYICNNPGTAGARQDFFSPSTTSNGMSALTLIYAGGAATTCTWYTHLEPLAGKFGALSFINATLAATTGAGWGINVQFGSGTYSGVSLPSKISTLGITQNMYIYLARSGGETVLVNPVLRDDTLVITGDTAGSAKLIDESWPDLAAGVVGTVVRDTTYPGSTSVTRIFTYFPGTLYQASDPLFLRIANASGTTAVNGSVTSSAGIQLPWQTYNTSTNVTTNLGPFSLVARRKDINEITASFTPTAPITYNNPLAADSYYTSDASAQTGISAINSSTKTVTIAAGTSITLDRRYDWLKWWLSQNLAITNFLSPSGTSLRYTGGWNDSVSGTSTVGTKLTSTSTTGTVTINSGGSITHSYQDSTGVRASITGLDPSALGTTWVLGWITTTNYNARAANTAPNTWTGWAQASGTGNSTQITLAANTEYQLFLRVPGYYAPVGPVATLNTSSAASITLQPVVDVDLQGSLLWPQSAAHTTQAANFAYNQTAQLVEYSNATANTDYITFLAAYRALETIAKAPSMAYALIQPLYLNGTRDGFTLPRSNPLLARMSAASTAGAILQADISYADNQAKAFDRFRSNTSHAFLLVPQMSATLSSSTVAAVATAARTAVKPDLAVINAGVKLASNIIPHKADLPA